MSEPDRRPAAMSDKELAKLLRMEVAYVAPHSLWARTFRDLVEQAATRLDRIEKMQALLDDAEALIIRQRTTKAELRAKIERLQSLLSCVATTLEKSMSKSMQKLQARTIRQELSGPSEPQPTDPEPPCAALQAENEQLKKLLRQIGPHWLAHTKGRVYTAETAGEIGAITSAIASVTKQQKH